MVITMAETRERFLVFLVMALTKISSVDLLCQMASFSDHDSE